LFIRVAVLMVVFFGFPERCSDLLRSWPGHFRIDCKKERRWPRTDVTMPTIWISV